MKILLLDHDGYAPQIENISRFFNKATVVTDTMADAFGGASPGSGIDAIIGGSNVSSLRKLIDSLLMWRTHAPTCHIPCWIATDVEVFKRSCLWPYLSIDCIKEQLDTQAVCDWLTTVSEWQQTHVLFSKIGSFNKCSPLELANSLSLHKATGKLTVYNNFGEEGALYIQIGMLADAKVKHLTGVEAFYEFLSWPSGSYIWDPCDSVEKSVENQPLQTLIEEGLKLLGDANIVFNFIPDLHYRIEKTDSESALDDGANDFYHSFRKLYSLINNLTSVEDLIRASSLSRPRSMSCLAKWFSLGDIKVSVIEKCSSPLYKAHESIEGIRVPPHHAEKTSDSDSEEIDAELENFLAVFDNLQGHEQASGFNAIENEEPKPIWDIEPQKVSAPSEAASAAAGVATFVSKQQVKTSSGIYVMDRSLLKADIRHQVARIKELPPLHGTLTRLIEIIHGQANSLEELESIIKYDLGLSAKVLGLANSSLYGLRGQIRTLSRAVTIIGIDQLKAACSDMLLMHLFNGRGSLENDQKERFWKHAFATAQIAARIASKRSWINREEAFLLGLLHDLGRVVMAAHFKERYKSLERAAQTHRIPMWYLELQAGPTHMLIGKWVAVKWAFPEVYQYVIEFHHLPEKSPDFKPEARIIHLADILANSREFPEPVNDELTRSYCRALYINEEEWKEYQAGLGEVWVQADQVWNLLK